MSGDNENLLSSVKFYALNDGNVHEFYDEWKFKTLALIRKKGWGVIFEDTSVAIPTEAEATAADATDEVKALYKANSEAYDQILMGCSGVPLGLVRRGQGDARSALEYVLRSKGWKVKKCEAIIRAFFFCRFYEQVVSITLAL